MPIRGVNGHETVVESETIRLIRATHPPLGRTQALDLVGEGRRDERSSGRVEARTAQTLITEPAEERV